MEFVDLPYTGVIILNFLPQTQCQIFSLTFKWLDLLLSIKNQFNHNLKYCHCNKKRRIFHNVVKLLSTGYN